MSHKRSSTQKFLSSLVITTVAILAVFSAYQYGLPWMKLHQENLVIYDCRIQSELVPVGAKYPGRIDKIIVNVGDLVMEGDLIARLDSRDLDASLKKVQASIKLAQASLVAEREAIEKALDTISAERECMLAKMEVATNRSHAIEVETKWIQKRLDRFQPLANRGSLSAAKLDSILREFQSFENKSKIANEEEKVAELDLARVQAQIKEIEARANALKILESKISIAESELEIIQEQKQASLIRSKSSGTVTRIFRGAGSSVKVGDPIIQIQGNETWCEVWIDESDLLQTEHGTEVRIKLKALPDIELKGVIESYLPPEPIAFPQSIDNPILQADAKIRLKVQLDAHDRGVLPGLTGTALIKRDASPAGTPENSLNGLARRK